jgi:hypothetical protein
VLALGDAADAYIVMAVQLVYDLVFSAPTHVENDDVHDDANGTD